MLIRQRTLANSAFPPPLAWSSSKMQWFSNQFRNIVHGGCGRLKMFIRKPTMADSAFEWSTAYWERISE